MDCVTPPYWNILTVAIKSCHKYRNYTVFQSGTNSILQTLPPNIICYDQLLVELTFFTSKVSPSQQVQRESIHIWEMEKHQFIMKLFTGWTSLGVEWSTKWQLIDDFIAFLCSLSNISRLQYLISRDHGAVTGGLDILQTLPELTWKTFITDQCGAVLNWIIQTCFNLTKYELEPSYHEMSVFE